MKNLDQEMKTLFLTQESSQILEQLKRTMNLFLQALFNLNSVFKKWIEKLTPKLRRQISKVQMLVSQSTQKINLK
jgi:predicted translin family RNA/ssDNA-binding protein